MAGLLLIGSAFGQSRRLALFLILAAAVTVAGPLLGVPADDLPGYGAAAAGFVLDRLT